LNLPITSDLFGRLLLLWLLLDDDDIQMLFTQLFKSGSHRVTEANKFKGRKIQIAKQFE